MFAQQMGAWSVLQAHFDTDRSNSIDPAEFCSGFLNWALDKPLTISAGQQWTLSRCHQEVQRGVNAQASLLKMPGRHSEIAPPRHKSARLLLSQYS